MSSRVLTVSGGGAGARVALCQLADAGSAAAAGDGGPTPAALLLPQAGTAGRDPLGAGDAAGQAGDAAGHRHLGWARLLGKGWGWMERRRREQVEGEGL